MTCSELRDHYDLFAVGVAEDPERSEIRAHLDRECPVCTPAVLGARELAALLATAVPAVQPPARLRRRVLAIAQPATSQWSWAPLWAAVAAAAVIAAIFFNSRVHRAEAELARAQTAAAAQTRELARLNLAFEILNQLESRQVVFGAGAPAPPRGRVFVHPRRGVLLIASNLPPAPAGKAYEMWVIPRGAKPLPAGLFQSAPDGTALHVWPGPVDVTGGNAVAVTLEPEGGVPAPTSQPIVVAAL